MTQLNTVRHAELFDPETFNTPVHVLGAGASGSWLVLQLAKLGITNISVWDYDRVEEHNVPNQLYGIDDIGQLKVDALYDYIKYQTGTKIKKREEKYVDQRLSGIVFCMIDTMSGRKQIWNDAIKMKSAIKLYVEPRMGMDVGRVYNLDPMNIAQHAPYEATLYSDDVAEVSACGASMSVITSSITLAAWCARQLINFHNDVPLSSEILLDLMYNNIVTTKWEG